MTATTYRRKSGSYWSYTLDGVPKIKGVTTMMKGLSGPPESYFTKFTAGHAVDNWERLAELAPSAPAFGLCSATAAPIPRAARRRLRRLPDARRRGRVPPAAVHRPVPDG